MAIKNFYISTTKIPKSFTITQLSDLHSNSKTPSKKYLKILKSVEKQQPDFITFVGDLVNDAKEVNKELLFFFRQLSELTRKVIVVKGNHDDLTLVGSKKELLNFKWNSFINDELFEEIGLIPNTHVLRNENLIIPEYNINFIGLELDGFKHYEQNHESYKDYIDTVNSSFPQAFDSNLFNILLSHSPKNVMQPKSLEDLNLMPTIDLIESGHMHNGIVPYWSEEFFDMIFFLARKTNNRGIIDPLKGFFPNYARGQVDFGNITGIIGAPLTCLPEDSGLVAKILNSFFLLPPAINNIKVLVKTK